MRNLFTALSNEYFTQKVVGDINMVINRVLSTSVISNKSKETHTAVSNEVKLLLAEHPETRGRREYELVYRTHMAYACKKN